MKKTKIKCCENADKNKNLEENCAKKIREIHFEFTSPDTPQNNGVIERGFATFYSRMHEAMAHTGLQKTSRLAYGPNIR